MSGRRRRRHDDSLIELVARLVVVVFALSLISPQVRQMIAAVGFVAICGAGVVLVAGLGWVIYRFATRERRTSFILRSVRCDTLEVEVAEEPKPPQPRTDLGEYVNFNGSNLKQAKPHTTAELIEQLRKIDWFQFEKLVALVYRKLDYAVTRRGGANPDGGLDLIIEKDGQRWAVQCKQWKTWNVGVKPVREFLGALTDNGIQKGILITLCGYTGGAKQLADKHGIEIINETGLAQMIEDTDARYDPETLEILNDKRKFCPKCEAELVLRTAKKGHGAGSLFWGCSAYPRCRFTMPV